MDKVHYNPNEDKETVLINQFGLEKYSELYNRPYDATDARSRLYELKSTSKSSVSTARDTSLAHIQKWRKMIWIVGMWDRASSKYTAIYVLTKNGMKEWLDKMEKQFIALDIICQKVLDCCEGKLTASEMTTLKKILKRGVTKNDPNIPNSYIRRNGVLIETKEDLEAALLDEA